MAPSSSAVELTSVKVPAPWRVGFGRQAMLAVLEMRGHVSMLRWLSWVPAPVVGVVVMVVSFWLVGGLGLAF